MIMFRNNIKIIDIKNKRDKNKNEMKIKAKQKTKGLPVFARSVNNIVKNKSYLDKFIKML